MIYFLYHKNCLDGYGSALAAYLKFKMDAEYIPVQHQEPVPHLKSESTIYLLDFCYPREVIETMLKNHTVIVLDHHKTALEDMVGLIGLKDSVFDLQRSGAMITWQYFHQEKQIPTLFKLIQDRDIWQWRYQETAPVTAALMTVGYEDLEKWLPYLEEEQIAKLTEMGKIILKANTQAVKSQLSMSYLGRLPGKKELIPMVNTPHLISETCQAMLTAQCYQEYQVVAAWYVQKERVSYSLRSRPGFDCAQIALEYGGGGHPQASGFSCLDKPE
ncbi:DHHA1 domain-containing protein [Gloeocapsa sp. PCC 73106]|uniref:DHHA1 domain-containing protein n=1 Tax=Gloeocapsa sp. PCC 73106 TaxID=102232 RepID=UPI0002ABBA6C|nr:DHHA1 domain-containing protein [Gloeocapsa sp. PCC 73106]ELR96729.1 putative DHD superfamily phosphohydrolase [Gloeocapsa sp. PCC 73106]